TSSSERMPGACCPSCTACAKRDSNSVTSRLNPGVETLAMLLARTSSRRLCTYAPSAERYSPYGMLCELAREHAPLRKESDEARRRSNGHAKGRNGISNRCDSLWKCRADLDLASCGGKSNNECSSDCRRAEVRVSPISSRRNRRTARFA